MIAMIVVLAINHAGSLMQHRKKIPVGEIIFRVFSSVAGNFWSFFRLGLPVIVMGLLSTIYYEIYDPGKELFGDFSLIGLGLMVLNTAAYGMAIMGIHQAFLLSSEMVANISAVRWTHKEMKWFLWVIIISFMMVLLALVPGCIMIPIAKESPEEAAVVMGIGGWVIGLLLGYFAARWSLIFPSLATDGHLKGLGEAWDFSQGNVLGLFILVGVIPMLTSWVMEFLPAERSLSLNIVIQLLGWIVALFEIGLLSHSYAFLRKDEDEAALAFKPM